MDASFAIHQRPCTGLDGGAPKVLGLSRCARLCVSKGGQGVRRYMSMTAVEGSWRTTTSAAPTRAPGTSPRIVRPSDRQVNLGMTGVRSGPRDVPKRIEDRLIVALDVPNIAQARAVVDRLHGLVSFFKIGLWLQFAAGFDGLLDDLIGRSKKGFPVSCSERHHNSILAR